MFFFLSSLIRQYRSTTEHTAKITIKMMLIRLIFIDFPPHNCPISSQLLCFFTIPLYHNDWWSWFLIHSWIILDSWFIIESFLILDYWFLIIVMIVFYLLIKYLQKTLFIIMIFSSECLNYISDYAFYPFYPLHASQVRKSV